MKKSTPKGIIFLIGAAVVWGGAFVVQCVAAEKITPFFFNASRFTVGAVSMIPVFLVFEKDAHDKKKQRNTVLVGIAAGVILALASYLQQVGVGLTDSAGKSGFITGLYMILVPIIGVFIGRKSDLFTWLGAVLGVAGLFFICMSDSAATVTRGDFVLIAGAFLFAAHIIVIDRFGEDIYPLRFSEVQFITSAAVSFIGAGIFESVETEPLMQSLIPVLYCGIFSVGVGYTFQTLGQKYSEPTSAAILLSTESVFSAVFGVIFLKEHESMGIFTYIGFALIFGGIVVSQLRRKKKA